MNKVKAKKFLGQHFLKDKKIAEEIVNSLTCESLDHVLEIGPGMGILSEFLLKKDYTTSFIEIDDESVEYLNQNYPEIEGKILHQDFLKMDIKNFQAKNIAIIGNFPYNISSQILFKVFDNRNKVKELVGMFQLEVANRVISKPGNKVYGILSVLIQAFYNTSEVLTLEPEAFDPPPKVKSKVIRLERNNVEHLNCDEKLFFRVIKSTFNQRRKTIRNSLKSLMNITDFQSEYLSLRPEQLSVEQFVNLTNEVEKHIDKY
ncbi:MAG: 16S rRNA (adenine(1518)-N(6)/adenine(1519)-N(6))-dimethyltransferase RsmA [Bacteroidota bacterium]